VLLLCEVASCLAMTRVVLVAPPVGVRVAGVMRELQSGNRLMGL
jgi:hypothetical protein